MKRMRLRAGTSGYSYKEWKGPFYPEKLPAKEMLGYYAERLPAVEINNTFYRLPKTSVLETWAAQVPEDFRFVLKASRRITHFKRLKEAGDETAYLLRTVAVLGDRLGALLFQLPPNLACDLERFDSFLTLLPEGGRIAFEFRHPSWLEEPGVSDRLRDHGAALVAVDDAEAPLEELVETADWGYLRLRGEGYGAEELAAWQTRIRATRWGEAFVFFKHEDAGAGPKLARAFQAQAVPRKAAAARPAARKREAG